jgi:hypothetical protein
MSILFLKKKVGSKKGSKPHLLPLPREKGKRKRIKTSYPY